jgi:hypothetical protein
MSNEVIRFLVAGFLVAHGIGHSGGYWFFGKSWLFPALANGPFKWIFVLVWLAAMIGFVIAGVGMFQHQSWWRFMAVVTSLVSLAVSVLFIQGPSFNAAAADVAILVALLALHWPSADVVGA